MTLKQSSFKERLGRNNPLLRRVRRHATMATLFRPITPASGHQAGSARPPAGHIVQATLMPQPAPDSPQEATAARQPAPERLPRVNRAAEESSPAPSPRPAPPAASPSPPQGPAPPAPQVQASPAGPEPPPEKDDSEEEDKNWRRLQAIYRAHERKRTAEAEQEGPRDEAAQEPPEATEEPLPGVETAGRVQRESVPKAPPEEGERAPATPRTTREAPSPPVAAPSGDEPERESALPVAPREEETAGDEQQQKEAGGEPVATEPPSPAGDDQVQAQAEAARVGQGAGKAGSEKAVREEDEVGDPGSPGGEPEAAPAAVNDEPAAPQARPGVYPEPATPSANVDASGPRPQRDPEQAPEEPAPLEAVWPVQRKEEPDDPSLSAGKGTAQTAQTPPITEEEAAAREAQVRARLEQVDSGRPSDSSVQLVPPRRPRLPRPPVESRREDAPSVREAPADAETATDDAAEAEAETVATEIGPLPADLWQLLGQEPPSRPAQEAAPQRPTPPSERPAPEEADEAVMRAIARSEAPSSTPSPAEDETETSAPERGRQEQGATPVIQRQVDPAVAPEADAGAGAPPDATAEEVVAPAEVDVDELARRVYSDIKRRLAVEWERVRGRF